MGSIEKYNMSYYTALKCTPIEATEDKTGHVMIENSPQGKYGKLFNEGKRVAKKENLKGADKYLKGRFLESGKVIERCGNDSYIVKLVNGRYIKKRHYNLKSLLGLRIK
ncbi:integrase catalytic domain-containing protein [Vairimorpha necatrix]